MRILRTDVGDETTLAVEGVLDAATAPEFRVEADQIDVNCETSFLA